MTTEAELMQITHSCVGTGHLLQAIGFKWIEEPEIRQELVNLMRLTADMIESQKFDINVPKRGKAFAMTMRELEARP